MGSEIQIMCDFRILPPPQHPLHLHFHLLSPTTLNALLFLQRLLQQIKFPIYFQGGQWSHWEVKSYTLNTYPIHKEIHSPHLGSSPHHILCAFLLLSLPRTQEEHQWSAHNNNGFTQESHHSWSFRRVSINYIILHRCPQFTLQVWIKWLIGLSSVACIHNSMMFTNLPSNKNLHHPS